MSSGVHRLSVAKSGATRGISGNDDPTELARPRLEPIDTSFSFKNKAYLALKSAIVGMDVYGSRHGIRLDERSLAQQFGISRTPVREAMAQLEREGFVRSVPRRGTERTKPSRSSCAMASRTGVRLMPNCSARLRSSRRISLRLP